MSTPCPHCGSTANPADARFCRTCGESLESSAAEEPTAASGADQPETEDRASPHTWRRRAVITAAAVLVLAGLAVGGYLVGYSAGDDSDRITELEEELASVEQKLQDSQSEIADLSSELEEVTEAAGQAQRRARRARERAARAQAPAGDSASPDGTYTVGQFSITDVQVREDSLEDFEVRARVTNNGDAAEFVSIEATLFNEGSVVGVADTYEDFDAGQTRTVTLTTSDDYAPWDDIEFTVDVGF